MKLRSRKEAYTRAQLWVRLDPVESALENLELRRSVQGRRETYGDEDEDKNNGRGCATKTKKGGRQLLEASRDQVHCLIEITGPSYTKQRPALRKQKGPKHGTKKNKS